MALYARRIARAEVESRPDRVDVEREPPVTPPSRNAGLGAILVHQRHTGTADRVIDPGDAAVPM